jgi:hypothetical protein
MPQQGVVVHDKAIVYMSDNVVDCTKEAGKL